MNTVALYIKDFQKGTIISDRLIAMDLSVEFIDKHNLFSNNYLLGIIDLDDEEFGRKEFIKDLKSLSLAQLGNNPHLRFSKVFPFLYFLITGNI